MTTQNNNTGKEVLNITPGGWITDKSHAIDREGVTIWAGDNIIADVVPDVHDQEEENAKAICNAVNGTYGKGIDPAGVEEVIKAAVNVLNWHKAHDAISFIEIQQMERLETALKNAKL